MDLREDCLVRGERWDWRGDCACVCQRRARLLLAARSNKLPSGFAALELGAPGSLGQLDVRNRIAVQRAIDELRKSGRHRRVGEQCGVDVDDKRSRANRRLGRDDRHQREGCCM